MDDVILRRLDCLSKKQLLAAIMAITDKQSSDSAVVTSLAQYLDTIPASVGSSRPLTASTSTTSSNPEVKIEKSVKEQGNFDISKYRTRQIALQVQYDGTAYLGFASQDLEETVENHLFNALLKLKLIEDRKTCRYSRCGRTDKGVSALGQVIALNVRSAIPKDLPESSLKLLSHPADKLVVAVSEAAVSAEVSGDSSKEAVEPLSKKSKKQKNNSSEKVVQEMDYVTMLNRALPDDIRVLGWTPVTEEFSARFSASHRTYRYFFQRKHLNIAAMRAAAELLLGSHDFRNICKLDIANVSNFVRDIYAVEIRPFQTCDVPETEETVYMLQITGIAFLWHMVRCIMAVLFMVGEGLEQPDVVNRLLDIDTCVGKPPCALAAEQPLVLHDCGFDNLQIPVQARHMWQLTAHYKNIQEYHLIAAARARNSLEFVLNSQVRQSDLSLFQEDLRLQEERHSKKAQKRHTTSTVLLETGTTTTSATSTDSVENNNTTTSNLKRKFVASSVEPPQQKDDIIDKDSECMVVWSSALQQIENTMGLAPKLKYVPHVPLMERKREDSYEKKIEQLAGSKKERLDRHISLSASAAATGATPEFFTKMRQQGSLV